MLKKTINIGIVLFAFLISNVNGQLENDLQFMNRITSDAISGDNNIGQDEAWHIHQLADNSYILTGMSTSLHKNGQSIGKRTFLMKLNSDLECTKKFYFDSTDHDPTHNYFGFEFHPVEKEIAATDLIFAGHTNRNGYDQGLVMKVNSDFDNLWTVYIGSSNNNTVLYSIQPYMENGLQRYIATGYERTGDYNSSTLLIVKLDDSGVELGRGYLSHTGNELDIGKSIKPIKTNGIVDGFIVAGYTKNRVNSNNPENVTRVSYDGVLARFNLDLTENWVKTYGDESGQFIEDVKISSDNNILFCGITTGNTHIRSVVCKTNISGDIIWTKVVNHHTDLTHQPRGAQSFILDNNNDIILAGFRAFGFDNGYIDVYYAKLAYNNGKIIWERTISDDGPRDPNFAEEKFGLADYSFWIQKTSDGGFVACGKTFSFQGNLLPDQDSSEVLIMKIGLTEHPCGDMDLDANGLVDVSDLIVLVEFVFNGGPPPGDLMLANVDGSPDDEVDISDMTYFVAFLFNNGAPLQCHWIDPN